MMARTPSASCQPTTNETIRPERKVDMCWTAYATLAPIPKTITSTSDATRAVSSPGSLASIHAISWLSSDAR